MTAKEDEEVEVMIVAYETVRYTQHRKISYREWKEYKDFVGIENVEDGEIVESFSRLLTKPVQDSPGIEKMSITLVKRS